MKQKILDNVTEYSANQLVEYIRTGVVTFDELIQDTDGEFSVEKRREVKQLLEIWGIERSGFFNGQGKWAKGFENQMV